MASDGLRAWLDQAQHDGALGPGDVGVHLEHADRYVAALGTAPTGAALDLGTGAGVPGLILALRWPSTRWVLLDGRPRRTRPLAEAVARLGLGDRVTVRCQRAEEAGHEEELRERFDLVVARSFGSPAVTAECGAALVAVGGRLAVSEPPPSDGPPPATRWPVEPLRLLGLVPAPTAPHGIRLLEKVAPTPSDRPRRVGVPGKRPLF
jgi:16S rRNA (guanine527-N7)-methyltransferase